MERTARDDATESVEVGAVSGAPPPSSPARVMAVLTPGAASLAMHGTGLVLRLAFMLALARYSGPSVIGGYGLLASIELVTIYLAGLEFHTFTALRYSLRPRVARLRLLVRCHRRILGLTLPIAAAVSIAAATLLSVGLRVPSLAAFAVVVVTGSLAQEIARYLVLTNRPVSGLAIGFVRTAAWQPLVIPFLGTDHATLDRILVAWLSCSVLGTAWGLWSIRGLLTAHVRPPRKYVLHALGVARGYYVVACASVIQGNMERFILQVFLGPAAVGVFSFFQTLANSLPALIQTAILNISLPQLLSQFGQRLAGRKAYLRRVLNQCLAAGIVLSAVICVVSLPLLRVVSRSQFAESFWILPALLLGHVLLMWSQPLHLALYAASQHRVLIGISTIALGASLALNVAMAAAFGLPGAVATPVLVSLGIALARRTSARRVDARSSL